MIQVAPSVLSADFSRLGAEIEDITRAGALIREYFEKNAK